MKSEKLSIFVQADSIIGVQYFAVQQDSVEFYSKQDGMMLVANVEVPALTAEKMAELKEITANKELADAMARVEQLKSKSVN